jgi:pilus assembly protein CpaC
LFRSDNFRAKKSDLVIFVTPVISDPALAPNTGLLARADRIDEGFRNEYGNPSPLLSDEEKANRMRAPRQPIEATPALMPAPIRSTPPVFDPSAMSAPAAGQAHEPAGSPATTPAVPQPPQPQPSPASMPPPGVAEALRMLNAAQHPPATDRVQVDAAQAALNGKVPAQQVGVLGSSAD